MTSRDFCYWLQGAFEVHRDENSGSSAPMTSKQVAVIQSHLNLVFKHEIDPSAGNDAHQAELNKIHNPDKTPTDSVMRC